MMPHIRFSAALLLAPVSAFAADMTPEPSPVMSAMSQMVQESQSREATALMRAYTAEAEVRRLRARVEELEKPAPAAKP